MRTLNLKKRNVTRKPLISTIEFADKVGVKIGRLRGLMGQFKEFLPSPEIATGRVQYYVERDLDEWWSKLSEGDV